MVAQAPPWTSTVAPSRLAVGPAALTVGDLVPQLAGARFEDLDQSSPAYGQIEGVAIARVERGSATPMRSSARSWR